MKLFQKALKTADQIHFNKLKEGLETVHKEIMDGLI